MSTRYPDDWAKPFAEKLGASRQPSSGTDTDGEDSVPPLWPEPYDPTPRDWLTNPPKSSGNYIIRREVDGVTTGIGMAHVTVGKGDEDGPEIAISVPVDEFTVYQMIAGEEYFYTLPLLPEIDSKWVHHKGAVYTVLGYTNLATATGTKFPITVVYQGPGNRIWSRPIHDWYRSFTRQGEQL